MVYYKAGLVLNFRYNSFYSKTIRMSGDYWTHSAWIRSVQDDVIYIQEALGSKTKKVTTTGYSKDQLDRLFLNNELEILDFGIVPDEKFKKYTREIEGTPYDYFAIFELLIERVCLIFGRTPKKFLTSKWGFKQNTSSKRVDCSEMVARGLNEIVGINVLRVLNLETYEQVSPQMISVLHSKLTSIRNG